MSEILDEIGCYAAATTTAASVKWYQLMYPTLSKQTVYKFKNN